MTIGHFVSMVAASINVSLGAGDGGTVQQVDGSSPFDTTVGVQFRTDGTVYTGKSVNGAAVTWSAAGAWIDPLDEADGTYSVRCTNIAIIEGPGDWTTEAAAEDAWIAISATRTWLSNKTAPGNRQFTCTFEVRKTAGPPPTTGASAYTFTINNVV